ETITFLKNACEKYNIDISDFSEDNYNEVYLYTEGIPDRIIKIAELLHSFDITGKITIQDIRTIIKSTNIIKSQNQKKKFFKSPYILVFGLIFLVILGFIITTTYMKNELNIVTDIKSKEINLTPIDNKPLHAEIEDNKTDTDNISGTISVKTEADKVELPKKPVKKCIKLKANLKLRELPTQNSPFKTVIPKGNQFTIIEKKGHWAKVNFGSETGWVKATTNLVKEFECN
ncbi:MAG: SH3 domain-containing protein, partial [Deferribacterales bacterium]